MTRCSGFLQGKLKYVEWHTNFFHSHACLWLPKKSFVCCCTHINSFPEDQSVCSKHPQIKAPLSSWYIKNLPTMYVPNCSSFINDLFVSVIDTMWFYHYFDCGIIDNVHFQNTAQLVQALTEKEVQYQLQVYSNYTCIHATVLPCVEK